MIPISPNHTREDLIALIRQLDGLCSALKETVEEKNKEIERLRHTSGESGGVVGGSGK